MKLKRNCGHCIHSYLKETPKGLLLYCCYNRNPMRVGWKRKNCKDYEKNKMVN